MATITPDPFAFLNYLTVALPPPPRNTTLACLEKFDFDQLDELTQQQTESEESAAAAADEDMAFAPFADPVELAVPDVTHWRRMTGHTQPSGHYVIGPTGLLYSNTF